MARAADNGFVQFTVAVEASGMSSVDNAATVERLCLMFSDADIPVTVAVPDNQSGLLDRLRISTNSMEVALAAPTSITSLQCDRQAFHAWLDHALARFSLQAVPVATICSLTGAITSNLDALARHGIMTTTSTSTAVCVPRDLSTPRLTRYGVYAMTSSAMLPGYGRLFGSFDAGYRAKAAMAKAIQYRGSAQIVVPTCQLAGHAPAWHSLKCLLKIAKLAHQAGSLRCETIQQAVRRVAPAPAQPQRSILRAA